MQNIQLSSTLKQNLSHLSEIKRSEMLGCIIFTKEILEYAEATTGQSDLPEEQARVIEQVCPLIGENAFQYMEGESIRLLKFENDCISRTFPRENTVIAKARIMLYERRECQARDGSE